MKITKRQLKRIIAEEHAIVYGTKKPARKRTRKLTAKQRRIVEAKKRKAILAEARRNYACDQVLEEGLGKFLKQIGGMFSKGMEQATKIKDATVTAWNDLGEKIDADENAMEAFRDEMKSDLGDIQKNITNTIKGYSSFKKIVDELPEEEREDKTKELYAAALALFKSELAALS